MLKKLSIILALLLLIINAHLSNQFWGFEEGYQYAVKKFTEIRGGHGTAYSYFAEQYSHIVGCMLFILVGKSIKKEILSQLVCIPALLLSLYISWHIYLQKSGLGFEDMKAFYELLKETAAMAYFAVFLALTLLIFQITLIVRYIFKEKSFLSTRHPFVSIIDGLEKIRYRKL